MKKKLSDNNSYWIDRKEKVIKMIITTMEKNAHRLIGKFHVSVESRLIGNMNDDQKRRLIFNWHYGLGYNSGYENIHLDLGRVNKRNEKKTKTKNIINVCRNNSLF